MNTKATLQIQDIEVKKGDTVLVRAAHIKIAPGSKTVLLGANGSGKSSLLYGIMSYPGYTTCGAILYDGTDISALSLEEKGKLGIFFAPQDIPEIEGLTLLQMLYGLYKKTTESPSNIVEYKKSVESKIAGYHISPELLLKSVGSNVSGGEKKQMELIALISIAPKLAILDEIDSGVDFETVTKIYTVVTELAKQGTAFLVVSHNMSEIAKMQPDTCYLAKAGVISLLGDASSLDTIIETGL
jgi:Fe-S cluster assembly ATP-binding protein